MLSLKFKPGDIQSVLKSPETGAALNAWADELRSLQVDATSIMRMMHRANPGRVLSAFCQHYATLSGVFSDYKEIVQTVSFPGGDNVILLLSKHIESIKKLNAYCKSAEVATEVQRCRGLEQDIIKVLSQKLQSYGIAGIGKSDQTLEAGCSPDFPIMLD